MTQQQQQQQQPQKTRPNTHKLHVNIIRGVRVLNKTTEQMDKSRFLYFSVSEQYANI